MSAAEDDAPAAFSDAEALARLRLARSENVGPATFRRLVGAYGSAEAALTALPDLARRGGLGRAPRIASIDRIEAEIEAGQALGARLLHLGEAAYPPPLAEIDSAPPTLWVRGDAARLSAKSVAIVGTRNASALGLRFAAEMAGALAREGLVVVSGLARGVDGAAHSGALSGAPDAARPGSGATVAVVAGGVDIVYPPENRDLQAEIAERGALVSEMPIGHEPRARDFPRRNRIIAGLSLGVVVIEGRERSGSLITAEAALDQGREVMAAPGHPMDPRAAGCNRLIRDGAPLIRSAADVLETLGPAIDAGYPIPRTGLRDRLLDGARGADQPALEKVIDGGDGRLRDRILALLGPSATPLDALVRAADAPAGAVSAALLELELAGRIAREPGGGATRLPGG